MELKFFRLIKTIVEEGSIAGSTEKLFLTQSAISHQLREMEDQLGFKVFHRARNKWELTEEGAVLYKLGEQVFSEIESGFRDIENIRKGSSGTIKLSTECYSFYHGLSAFIQRMGLLYPDIKVELILEATHQPISKLLEKVIDIALVTEMSEDPSLVYQEIGQDEIYAVLHQEHPLAAKDYLAPEDFAEAHLIIHSFPLETVSVYQHFLRKSQVDPMKISAIPLTEVALEMVSANMGLICMPKWALQSFRLGENLLFKRLGPEGLSRKHYLAFRTEDGHKKYIKDFLLNFQDDFVISG